MPRLLAASAVVVALNLPFGFWRAGARKFSLRWLLAIHTPVPLVVAVRLASGLGWQLITFPVLIGAFFAGQFVGGRLRRYALTWSADSREPDPQIPAEGPDPQIRADSRR